MSNEITIIGGGLAGCEAAWVISGQGHPVRLVEMRPVEMTPAHQTGDLAEIVCSNSFKSESPVSASKVLKQEMTRMGSLVLQVAEAHRVPAGMNLSVDRKAFAAEITRQIEARPGVSLVRERMDAIPAGVVIVASGPLTSAGLAKALGRLLGQEHLYFFDAIAPIVTAESLNRAKIFEASRYGKGDADYLNCPFNQEEYQGFVQAVMAAEKHPVHDFEKDKFFEGCMPIEDMAARGPETLRFGPMKPVGLRDPATGRAPYACVQLRRENAVGTLYNLVGFQSRMKWGAQAEVFRRIPGLENAEFVRYGSLHRNTYINAPAHLAPGYQFKGDKRVFFAGQITGVEGYMESAASGILAGLNALRYLKGLPLAVPPRNSMLGSLIHYQKASDPRYFQPMNANWSLVEPLDPIKGEGKNERYERYAARARGEFEAWLEREGIGVASKV